MAELPPIEIEYRGEEGDGRIFGLRLIFEQTTVSLALRVTGTDWALHAPKGAADPSEAEADWRTWVEQEFRQQYSGRLRNDLPVLNQVQAWKANLPLYLRFADTL